MRLFDLLLRRNREKKDLKIERDLLLLTEVEPGIKLPKAFADHWTDLKKLGTAFASIKAFLKNELTIQESKFGHYPCIPLDYAYPKDNDGRFMYPLAQINCKDLPDLNGYPNSGYLQFYISAFSDIYGLDLKHPQNQEDFRVLYFTEKETEQFKTDFSFLQEVMQSDMVPVYKPHSLVIKKAFEYIGLGDIQCEKQEDQIQNIMKEHPTIENELWDASYDAFSSNGHKIGGYAYFTQEDPRIHNEKFKEFVLLFQLDSDEHIMWGDMGIANFFIHPDDLAKKDFTKVMYNWDCT